MESTGVRDKIQLSVATAKLLIKAGKGTWIEKREGMVDIKGKGSQETFFVRDSCDNVTSGRAAPTVDTNNSSSEARDKQSCSFKTVDKFSNTSDKSARLVDWNTDVLARHIIAIVKHQKALADSDVLTNEEVSPTVMTQLRHFVQMVASMYNNNPFHNFSHASHVTLSIEKMLSRVERNSEFISDGFTNNICSDPLVQFAAVLAALIHDCDRKYSNTL
jgi:hypothetical protein